jgi:hypothetical protein
MKVTRSNWMLMTAACLIVASSAAQSAADRPPGVDENSWVPLSESAGIVLTNLTGMPATVRLRGAEVDAVTALRAGTGILMVRHGGGWIRVDLELPQPRVQPLL